MSFRFRFLAIPVASIFVGDASGAGDPAPSVCWEHTMEAPNRPNVLSLCVRGDSAIMSVYYPNTTSPPTTCFQSGKATLKPGGALAISLGQGVCQNGNAVRQNELACSPNADQSLTCTIAGVEGAFRFARK
jgi:hypothetical protein